MVDLAVDDFSRRRAADVYKVTKRLPETLQVILVSRLQGLQSIHRAELTAVITICEGFIAAEMFTDSNFAGDLFRKVQSSAHVSQFIDHGDYDLIQRLHACVPKQRVLHKVKAHMCLESVPSLLDTYHALGNHIADRAAVEANKNLFPELCAQLESHHLVILMTLPCCTSCLNLSLPFNGYAPRVKNRLLCQFGYVMSM